MADINAFECIVAITYQWRGFVTILFPPSYLNIVHSSNRVLLSHCNFAILSIFLNIEVIDII